MCSDKLVQTTGKPGQIDDSTRIGRIFYFGPGAMYRDIALPMSLRLDANVGGGVLMTDPRGAIFPDEMAISHKEWNRHIARHCTGFTDRRAPEKGPSMETATGEKPPKPRRTKSTIVIEQPLIEERSEGPIRADHRPYAWVAPADLNISLDTCPKDVTEAIATIRAKGIEGINYRIIRICKIVSVNVENVERRSLV